MGNQQDKYVAISENMVQCEDFDDMIIKKDKKVLPEIPKLLLEQQNINYYESEKAIKILSLRYNFTNDNIEKTIMVFHL